MATADASLKKVQAKGVTNPVQLAMLAGKPVSKAAAAPLTAFQNILVVRVCSHIQRLPLVEPEDLSWNHR